MRQARAMLPVIAGNLKSARWSSLVVAACVMLVVLILAAFLAMAQGFKAASESAGSDNIVVFLGRQSQSEANSQITREQIELLANAPAIKRLSGVPAMSPELTMTISGKRRDNGRKLNAGLRGLSEAGLAIRPGFTIVDGRIFQAGRSEAIIGRKLSAAMADTDVGDIVTLAGRQWDIVGTYALDSEVFESELYADLGAVQSAYGRENQVQSIRAEIDDASQRAELKKFLASDPRLDLEASSEKELYAEQVESTSDLILVLGWPLAIILAVGATTGVFNTMLIVLEGRRHTLRTLSMLGFTIPTVIAGVVVETIILALCGAAAGLALVYIAVNGADASMVGQGFSTVNYTMKIDTLVIVQALGLAIAIGIFGGLIPSLGLLKSKRV